MKRQDFELMPFVYVTIGVVCPIVVVLCAWILAGPPSIVWGVAVGGSFITAPHVTGGWTFESTRSRCVAYGIHTAVVLQVFACSLGAGWLVFSFFPTDYGSVAAFAASVFGVMALGPLLAHHFAGQARITCDRMGYLGEERQA